MSIRFGKTVPSFFGEVVSIFWSYYAILMQKLLQAFLSIYCTVPKI